MITGMMRVQYSCKEQSSATSKMSGRTNGIIFLFRNSLLRAGRTRWCTIRCSNSDVGKRVELGIGKGEYYNCIIVL